MAAPCGISPISFAPHSQLRQQTHRCPFCLEVRRTFESMGIQPVVYNVDAMPAGAQVSMAFLRGEGAVMQVLSTEAQVPHGLVRPTLQNS